MIAEATADQPAARAALTAALAEPFHAYLLAGPPGSGKSAAARALAAELLAEAADDPESARRRALADPSPHPDLVWLRPPGTQHLVEEVRERVIAQVAYRPFEGERRVFVIEAAEAMAEESQNALLKTLEEPPPFAHLILISAEPEALLETVRSRCRVVRFARLAPDAVEERLSEHPPGSERTAAARLAGGDPARARFLLGEEGRALRVAVEELVRAVRSGELAGAPWEAIAKAADAAGERESEAIRARAAEAEEEAAERTGPAARRRARDAEESGKRASRRARNATLDLGLGLLGAWMRDLAAASEGAPELAFNGDRQTELAELAAGLDPRRARRAGELVLDTRRRLTVNVSETLALEALAFRLEFLLASG
ncbi:MAG: polymerase subunit delta [Solirubrobacterales bacterium]|nr:polymerase subunit delta [Solirubrobacterales bacterium]